MASNSVWSTLPSIILVDIFSYLPLHDRINASAICKSWRESLFHPLLWHRIELKINKWNIERSRFFGRKCGLFIREAVIQLDSLISHNVKEFLDILEIFSKNIKLEKLILKPSHCRIMWPNQQGGHRVTLDRCLDALELIFKSSKHLKSLSFGCIQQFLDHVDSFLPLLASRHGNSLEELHIASIKEDPDSYGVLELDPTSFQSFSNIRVLSIDYDYVSDELLEVFAKKRRVPLSKLNIHVHGIEHDHPKVSDASWRSLNHRSPQLKVRLTLLFSQDAVDCLLDILRPSMPLTDFQMFFCNDINTSAIDFIAQHNNATLQSITIYDCFDKGIPLVYESNTNEDPFVMLAWKCQNLKRFSLIGYEIAEDNVIAIARLRGQDLKTFEVPQCCIVPVYELDIDMYPYQCVFNGNFNDMVSTSLGRPWKPISDQQLHSSVKNLNSQPDTLYLPLILNDH